MRKSIVFILFILLFVSSGKGQYNITLITDQVAGAMTGETKAVYELLVNDLKINPVILSYTELGKKNALKNADIVWIHEPTFTSSPAITSGNLKRWVEDGGKLLLSLQALKYVIPLFGETASVRDSLKPVVDNGYGRRLGLHAFMDHPVFKDLHGGAYLQRPVSDTSVAICGFFGKENPKGRVIGTDWDYIFLRENSKLLLEYNPGKGKVIAIGAYMNYSLPNYNYRHLTIFTKNVLDFLACKDCPSGRYWQYGEPVVRECQDVYLPDILVARPPESVKWEVREDDPLTLKNPFATENFWDVAGERMLVMGIEKGGIEEAWSHPFMAFRDYEVGIRFAYRDTLYRLRDERPEIEVHPGYFVRTYKFNRAYLKEIVVADPRNAAGVVHYEYQGVYEATLEISYRSNLRLMWPYSESTTGSLCHYWNPDLEAYLIKSENGISSVILGANRSPAEHQAGKTKDLNDVSVMLKYNLKMNDRMDVAFMAGFGEEDLFLPYRDLIAVPKTVFRAAKDHAAGILQQHTMITTPDANFNKGYRWAMLATDRFLVNTPGMGKSLVAGYSTTRNGWDGEHKINGRPGYGWYFGRDGEWSGFALLDYGDFAKVRDMLEFFRKYQDLSGKILHEATTSGVIHYDAADATPLYIVLAGKYFRHTGDTAFLKDHWPAVRSALDFCFSTDTDNDHLIENTNVGHGWVEGGELYGSHSTVYMQGAWAAALSEAYGMSAALGDPQADSYRMEARAVAEAVVDRFWDKKSDFPGYGIDRNGKLRTEPTILPAVPIYFRTIPAEMTRTVMSHFASNAFTTNWGTRILREDSRLFRPTGYHYGSVWPLFTGWASLAEYTTGNAVQGFYHMMNNLNIYRNWGLGFAEEVLNGARYEPSGVCPHQCWSETMVLQPAIEGMLGFKADASAGKITLAPGFPAHWDSVSVQNLKMAGSSISFRMDRKMGKYIFRFSITGKPVQVEFIPALPSGTRVLQGNINGTILPMATVSSRQSVSLATRFLLDRETVIEIISDGGICVLPLVQDPKPGESAEGCRIISYGLEKDIYKIDLEAPSGTTAEIDVFAGTMPAGEINGATIVQRTGNILKMNVKFDQNEKKYQTRQITLKIK